MTLGLQGYVEVQWAHQQQVLLLQFPTLWVLTNKEKNREKKYKSLSIYLNSKRKHEASDVELLKVQPLKKSFSIGNTIPPRVVFSIIHGLWGKHELRWVHQNLCVIPTHQLAPHPLRQIQSPQAHSFKELGNFQSQERSKLQVSSTRKGLAGPRGPIYL